MFVKLKLNSNLPVGTVVCHDAENDYWIASSNGQGLIGVVGRDPVQDATTLEWSASIYFASTIMAIADRDIPNSGGNLGVLNGKVYVDNNSSNLGIVSPNARGQDQRVTNDLVMIHIK